MSRTDQIAGEVATVMPRIARWLLFDFFQSVQIPQTQLFTILILNEHGPCRFSELCEQMHISAPTATGLVDRMEHAGLVRREHDTADRRAVNILLTPKGKTLARKLKTVIHRRWRTILQELPPEDRENYLRILKTIQSHLFAKGGGA